jgi:AraC-like DNA-binding protein
MPALAAFFSGIVAEYRARGQESGVSIDVRSAEGEIDESLVPYLNHDLTLVIEQLLEFVPAGGTIRLSGASGPNGSGRITIQNSGIDLHVHKGIYAGCHFPTECVRDFEWEVGSRFELQFNRFSQQTDRPSENNFYLEIQRRLQSNFSKSENVMARLQEYPREAAFMTRVNQVIQNNLSDAHLDVNRLAELMNMSRTQLFRRLKPILGQSAAGYIRTVRLKKAKELLETTELRVGEVAFLTGFETPSTFTKVFVKAFGMKPSVIAKNKGETNEQENATA